VNDLDSLWKPGSRLYARSDAKLGVLLADRSFSYDPVLRTWAGSTNLPKGNLSYLVLRYDSKDGAQMLLTGIIGKRHLIGFGNDHMMQSLLQHDAGRMRGMADPSLDAKIGPPRWDWPQAFDLEGASFLRDEDRLVTLNPRKIGTGYGALLSDLV